MNEASERGHTIMDTFENALESMEPQLIWEHLRRRCTLHGPRHVLIR